MSLKSLIDSFPHAFQVKAESLMPQTVYVTNGMGFAWGAVTFNEWIMAITLLLGILTFIVNIYFQRKRDKREQELLRYKTNPPRPPYSDDG